MSIYFWFSHWNFCNYFTVLPVFYQANYFCVFFPEGDIIFLFFHNKSQLFSASFLISSSLIIYFYWDFQCPYRKVENCLYSILVSYNYNKCGISILYYHLKLHKRYIYIYIYICICMYIGLFIFIYLFIYFFFEISNIWRVTGKCLTSLKFTKEANLFLSFTFATIRIFWNDF